MKPKYKPGDEILYSPLDSSVHYIGKILSIGEEDTYWIEWQGSNKHITENPIYEIDSDKNVHLLTPTTLILYGSN